MRGFYTWHDALTATVTNKALTSNVATLTTSVAHNFQAGDTVEVSGVDATFNGTFTILATPTSTTFTYAKTASNVTSGVATGTAVVDAGPRAVADLTGGTTDSDYNVPGNVNYNADLPTDTIINSVEDPES